jgi:hypothetical protein
MLPCYRCSLPLAETDWRIWSTGPQDTLYVVAEHPPVLPPDTPACPVAGKGHPVSFARRRSSAVAPALKSSHFSSTFGLFFLPCFFLNVPA